MLRLAVPVVIIQVGMMAMGVVDTIMVGHISAQALAAVALGNLYFFTLAVFAMGTLMVLDPVVAQAVGAGDHACGGSGGPARDHHCRPPHGPGDRSSPAGRPGLRPAGAARGGHPAGGRLRCPDRAGYLPVPSLRRLPPEPPGHGADRADRGAIVAANLVNAALNWILIFGHLGLPAMGVIGSAWATTISRLLLVLWLWVAARRQLSPLLLPVRPEIWQPQPLLRMLRLGLPIGAQHVLEFGAFALVALMMGWIGTREMAGHQVAINLAALTFMVPLGVGDAASVLVGQAVGRGDPDGTRGAARAAFACGVTFMTATAAIFLTLPGRWPDSTPGISRVIAVAAALIPIAGVFQVFDGTQVVAAACCAGWGILAPRCWPTCWATGWSGFR